MTSRSRDRARDSRAEGAGPRRERLGRVMLEELRFVVQDAADPRLEGLRLLHLELSADGGHARIGYAAPAVEGLEEPEVARRTREALEAAAGFLRARLGAAVELKRLPSLGFTFIGLCPGSEGVTCQQ